MYIPHSQRNNITDPELAGLLDFLEREMGWDISISESISDRVQTKFYQITYNGILIQYIVSKDRKWIQVFNDKDKTPVYDSRSEIFFCTYKTILPEIRNLYSK